MFYWVASIIIIIIIIIIIAIPVLSTGLPACAFQAA